MQRELIIDQQSLMAITKLSEDGTEEIDFVILPRDRETDSAIPFSIGQYQHAAICVMLKGVTFQIPTTYDLFKNILVNLGAMLTKIVITDLKNDVLLSKIYLEKYGQEIVVDSHLGDAIVLALCFDSPIFIEENLFLEILDSENAKEALDFIEKNRLPLPESPDFIDTGD